MINHKKLLYISSVTPDTSCGAHLAVFRHLVYKKDFDVCVFSTNAENAEVEKTFKIQKHPIIEKLRKTRFSRFIFNLDYIVNWFWLPRDLLDAAKKYNPDVIFTVPDNLHSGLAYKLSQTLNIPLVTDFQDLFPLSNFIPKYCEPFGIVRWILLRKFHYLHQKSEASFYTSEGMSNWFGNHLNGHILYPIGDFDRPKVEKLKDGFQHKKPIKLIYAGNCYGAYGRMLLDFAKKVKYSKEISLKIFPVGKGWSDSDILEMTNAGIYQSFLPFEELRQELSNADAFLTVMSFEEQEKPFVSTSFTTKWLDYAPYSKPIFVWGPNYSSAALFARKYSCGFVIDTNDADTLKNSIISLNRDSEYWIQYGKNARTVSDSILNPSKIHKLFVNKISDVID